MKELASSYSKIFIILLLSFIGLPQLSAQVQPTPIQDIDSLIQVEPKPMLILLSTDWCQYCQMQKMQIRKNEAFLKNKHNFYYSEFDAETKQEIIFNGIAFNYKPTGIHIGTHTLAEYLNGDQQLVYPTWVILDPHYNILFRHQGVLLPKEIKKLMEILQ